MEEKHTLLSTQTPNQIVIKKGKLVVAFLFIGMMLLAITFITLFLIQYFQPKGNQIFIGYASNFASGSAVCTQYFLAPNVVGNTTYFVLSPKPVAFDLAKSDFWTAYLNQTVYTIQYRGRNVQPAYAVQFLEYYYIDPYGANFFQILADNDQYDHVSVDALNNVVIGGFSTLRNPFVFTIGPIEVASQVVMC